MSQVANWGTVIANRRAKTGRSVRRLAALSLAMAAGAMFAGCEIDSYFDPSIVGRWEHTPAIAPILERIAAIEGASDENVESSKVRPEDLIPDVDAYRVGPGDGLEITIQDLFRVDFSEKLEREIDPRGYVDLPQVPSVYIDNMTVEECRDAIGRMYRDRNILTRPSVEVVVRSRRKLTFNVIGGSEKPGLYSIPRPDYRLLEGLAAAGRFSESVQYVYVIRQIPLSDAVTGRRPQGPGTVPSPAGPSGPATPGDNGKSPEKPKDNMIDLIDDLSRPKDKKPEPPKPSPGMMRPQPATQPPAREPVVDLDDPAKSPAKPKVDSAPQQPTEGPSNWEFINGQWVKVVRRPDGTNGPTSAPGQPSTGTSPSGGEQLLTQRVIQIPMAALVGGNQQYNIVLRPGDIVRVPSPPEGLVYVTGQVERPGPYNMPQVGRLTVLRAIDAAGNFNQTAIPERVDLTRMVGPDRQATIRLNLRAIAEHTQPDIFLRSDDRINVGSNFLALPLAVFRNGLRASYGFGFILDRNFGFDVFGPQRTQTPF